MKISFDFDYTLQDKQMQNLAESFIKMGHEVFIITSRSNTKSETSQKFNKEVFDIAKKVGIKEENIYFCSISPKWMKCEKLQIDIHYDDLLFECEEISAKTKTRCILVK